jgi:hypothetical protein
MRAGQKCNHDLWPINAIPVVVIAMQVACLRTRSICPGTSMLNRLHSPRNRQAQIATGIANDAPPEE